MTQQTGPAVFSPDGSHTHAIPAPVQPVPTPTPTPVPSAPPFLPALTAIGTGSQGVAWAQAILAQLGAPQNTANINSLNGWFAMEDNHATVFGTHADGAGQNNPLNVTPSSGNFAGTTGTEPSGAGPGHPGNYNFDTPAHGVAATAQVLSSGPYAPIAAALKAGGGLIGLSPSSAAGKALSTWSGGGYSSIQWPV